MAAIELATPASAKPAFAGVARLNALAVAGLTVLCWFLFFRGLADRDLWSSHEARAAMDAQSVLDTRDALPRQFDGRPEVQKPPLYYWLVALVARVSGTAVDAQAVRLPAALAGLGGVVALYGFGMRRGRPLAGFVAAVMLATALHYTWLSRVGRIDMPLTFTTTLALLAFYRAASQASTRRRLRPLIVAYLALAIGVLLKGPVVGALPLGVAGAWLLVNRELPWPWRVRAWLTLLHRYGLWWGLPLAVGVVLPIYLWANARTGGEFFRAFLWHHNIERGLGGSEVLRAHPWWFYLPHLAADFLPWSLLLPVAAWAFVRRRWWSEDAEARFGLVWLVTVTVLLSAARFKRADYLLPAFPGAALFLGCVAERWYQTATRPALLASCFAVAVAACVGGWWFYLDADLRRREPARQAVEFADAVRRRAPAPQPVLFFRTEAHAAAFHVGRPQTLFVEWNRLDAWTRGPLPTYVVMPARVAAECPRHLRAGCLHEVLRKPDSRLGTSDWTPPAWLPARLRRDLERFLAGEGHERPLVLLRTVPP